MPRKRSKKKAGRTQTGNTRATAKKRDPGLAKGPQVPHEIGSEPVQAAAQTGPESNLLDWALSYIHRGWAVLPLHTIVNGQCSCRGRENCKPGKHPQGLLAPHGPKDASKDETIIQQWFSGNNLNIGIATGSVSGLVVIDVDPRRGGEASLQELESRYGKLETLEVKTGGGGRHLYFLAPGGHQIRNSSDELAPGLDVRGEAGFVVVPPSVHVSGRSYTWNESTAKQPARCPIWLLDLLQKPKGRKTKRPRQDGPIPEGCRDDTLTRLAGELRREGLDQEAIYAQLEAVNEARCQPPLDEADIRKIAASVSRYPAGVGCALLDRLNQVRDTPQKAFRRKQQIVEMVRRDMETNGRFLRTKDDQAFYFYNPTHRLLGVARDSRRFLVHLYLIAGLNQADTDWAYIMNDLVAHALAHGEETEIWQFCRYQNKRLYISDFNGNMYVLDGSSSIHTAPNGTDGILFLDRPEWEPWTLVSPSAESKLWPLINRINFQQAENGPSPENYRGLLMVVIVSLFFIDLMPTRVLVLFLGEKGSGKTAEIRQVGRMLFGRGFDVKTIMRAKEEAFVVLVAHHYLVGLDNVDGSVSWLNDRLATISTGGSLTLRELYTTSGEREVFTRCFAWLSARTPQFRRDDVADRLLIFRLGRISSEAVKSERELLEQVTTQRDHLMSELLQMLNIVVGHLACVNLNQYQAQFRLADFASLGAAISHALWGDPGLTWWQSMIPLLRTQQHEFVLEDDPLPRLIDLWLGQQTQCGPVSPSQLYEQLSQTATSNHMVFSYPSPKSLGKRLSNIRSNLEERCGIRIDERSAGGGTTLRTFQRCR